MLKTIVIGNLVRDGKVNAGKDDKPFTGFAVAVEIGYGDKKTTIYPEGTVNGDAVAQYLTKGKQIMVVSDGIETYEYTSGKGVNEKVGIGHRFINGQLMLGDAVYVIARGRLTADASPLEGKDFAVPTLLSNVKAGKEDAVVASSFVLGAKGLDAVGKYFVKGKTVAVAGAASIRAYAGSNGPGAEVRFNSIDFALGPDPQKKGESAEAIPETVGGSDDDNDFIPD
ncbi:single-stranded DNA-binding protein [Nevskia ramosa]|uniref:single-stranded DNA-binding protein n=1 Tax=Nevskia ramosa TaxID=64002 RepID=UPI00235368AE|nr:single-stranded DNA-binding protein [Nevskia ramosa]